MYSLSKTSSSYWISALNYPLKTWNGPCGNPVAATGFRLTEDHDRAHDGAHIDHELDWKPMVRREAGRHCRQEQHPGRNPIDDPRDTASEHVNLLGCRAAKKADQATCLSSG